MRNWCHWARQVIGTYAPRWDPLLDQAVQGRLIIQGQPKHLSSWERSPHTGHQIRSEGHTLIPTSMWDCCAFFLKKKKKKLSCLIKTAFGKQFTLLILLVCVLGFFFRYTYKWDHMYFSFSLWLMSLSTMPSRSIHIVSNSKNSFFLWLNYTCIRFPWWLNDKESHLTMQELWVWSLGREDPWGGKIPGEGNGTLFHLPRKSQGQRSLAGYSPRSRKKVRYDLATKQQ